VSVDKPTKEEQAYWEQVLHDHKQGIHRGRRSWLVYGHEFLDCDKSNEDDYSEDSNP
jgi:hypothetical protein